MAKVHFVKSARKDNPAVKAGESYYWWKFRYGGKRYSATYPKPSQLTQSPFWSGYHAAREAFEEAPKNFVEEFEAARDTLAEAFRELSNEASDSFDNLPENFQYGENGQRLEQRRDELESLADDVEGVEVDFDEDDARAEAALELEDEDEIEESVNQARESAIEQAISEVQEYGYEGE